jgi:hypothetical protein
MRRSSNIMITLVALALIVGGAAMAWWAVGDLTEAGVRDPNYMFTSPKWAAQHPLLIATLGGVVLAVGLVVFNLVIARVLSASARTRAIVFEVSLVADGLVIGFVLRLLTVGAEGASFTGLTLFLAVPPVIIVSALLIGATRRLARTA